MALWKDNTASRPAPTPAPAPTPDAREPARFAAPAKPELAPTPTATPPRPELAPGPAVTPVPPVPRADTGLPRKESLIAADITIEGKIEGGGSVRIAGKFKGDASVQGDLTIEAGAKLIGSVRADKVTIAGELEGNVEEASHVDLLQTGAVIGDLTAGSVTVAAGARMRGHAEFGWGGDKGSKAAKHSSDPGAASSIRS